jgi:integrase
MEHGVMRFEDHKTSEQAGTKVLPLNTRVMDEAKLTNVTPHHLRRTFMSTSMELGYPAAIGDALLGHSLGKIRDTYVHLQGRDFLVCPKTAGRWWPGGNRRGIHLGPLCFEP